jgi:hypothetical protein
VLKVGGVGVGGVREVVWEVGEVCCFGDRARGGLTVFDNNEE